jgi:hypothetical protein
MRESLRIVPIIHSVALGQHGLWTAVGVSMVPKSADWSSLTAPMIALRNIMSFSTGLSR